MSSLHSRRHILAGLGLILAAPALIGRAAAQDFVNPFDFGLQSEAEGVDQTSALQQAIDAAAQSGRDLRLPAGSYFVRGLKLHGHMRIFGSSLQTNLFSLDEGTIGRVGPGRGLVVDGVSFFGVRDVAALALEATEDATIRNCTFSSCAIGIGANAAGGTVEGCRFEDLGDAAIHSVDSL